ncbi:hypothetical protein vseg_003573 [Gypsophila vaccaria]
MSSGDTKEDDEDDYDLGDHFADDGPLESFGSMVKIKRGKFGRFEPFSKMSSSSGNRGKGKRKKDKSRIINDQCPWGPEVVNVIPSFGGHMDHVLWSNPDGGRPVLMGYHRVNKLSVLVKRPMLPDGRSLVARSGLLHLVECMVKHLNMPLLSAFVERWQPDTNTFHLHLGK